MDTNVIEVDYREFGICPRCKSCYPGYRDSGGFHPMPHECEPPYIESGAWMLKRTITIPGVEKRDE